MALCDLGYRCHHHTWLYVTLGYRCHHHTWLNVTLGYRCHHTQVYAGPGVQAHFLVLLCKHFTHLSHLSNLIVRKQKQQKNRISHWDLGSPVDEVSWSANTEDPPVPCSLALK